MNTGINAAEREKLANRVIREFRPIVGRFGFSDPQWDYDAELGIVRVQFEDKSRANVVQIDYRTDQASYNANYCRNDGQWQICAEGKPKNLDKLKATLPDWLLKNCEDWRLDCEPQEPWKEHEHTIIPCSHCDDSGHTPKVSP
jgi:hypothetical protein